jgi:methionine-rich copper-binding protein CopC
MKRLAFSLAMVGVLALAGAVGAHPHPKTTSPAANAVLAASPSEIRIDFNEGVVLAFSGIALSDKNGKPVDLGAAHLQAGDNTKLAAPVKARLGAGTYTVAWHAVGTDTHHTSGHYSFSVKP